MLPGIGTGGHTWANGGPIDWMEAQAKGRGGGTQAEVKIIGVDEEGISDDGLLVVAGRLPCRKRLTSEEDARATAVEVDVLFGGEQAARPIAAEEAAAIEIVPQGEGAMRFGARAHQLIFTIEGEDVIAHDIVAAVMLVKTGALAVVDDIVLD